MFDVEDDPLEVTYEPSSSQVSIQLSSQSSQSVNTLVDDRKFLLYLKVILTPYSVFWFVPTVGVRVASTT